MLSMRRRYGLLAVPFGVFAGHVVGYRLAHPNGIAQEVALGATHDYLAVTTWASVALAVGALGWAAVEGTRGHRSGFTISTLLRAQTLAFVAIEILERAGSPDPFADLVRERGVWIGLAAQVVLAVAAAALLRAGSVLGELFVGRSPSPPERTIHSALHPGLASRLAAITAVERGPPAVAVN